MNISRVSSVTVGGTTVQVTEGNISALRDLVGRDVAVAFVGGVPVAKYTHEPGGGPTRADVVRDLADTPVAGQPLRVLTSDALSEVSLGNDS